MAYRKTCLLGPVGMSDPERIRVEALAAAAQEIAEARMSGEILQRSDIRVRFVRRLIRSGFKVAAVQSVLAWEMDVLCGRLALQDGLLRHGLGRLLSKPTDESPPPRAVRNQAKTMVLDLLRVDKQTRLEEERAREIEMERLRSDPVARRNAKTLSMDFAKAAQEDGKGRTARRLIHPKLP